MVGFVGSQRGTGSHRERYTTCESVLALECGHTTIDSWADASWVGDLIGKNAVIDCATGPAAPRNAYPPVNTAADASNQSQRIMCKP